MSVLSAPHFHNEAAAIARLEEIVWPQGPHCPRCGSFDRITDVKGGRAGLRRCGPCKREFTVTVGTIFERSHVKLHTWFQAAHLMASSKKGISAHQLHRTLKVTYKTAWFMEHRLREATREGYFTVMGGEGKIVEADETYIGGKEKTSIAANAMQGILAAWARRLPSPSLSAGARSVASMSRTSRLRHCAKRSPLSFTPILR